MKQELIKYVECMKERPEGAFWLVAKSNGMDEYFSVYGEVHKKVGNESKAL